MAKQSVLILAAVLGAASQLRAQDPRPDALPAFSWDAPLPATGINLQEPPPPPVIPPPAPPPRRPRQDDGDMVLNAAIHGRWSLPFGAAERDVVTYGGGFYAVNSYVGWDDLFHAGWGVELEVDILFGGGRRGDARGMDYGLAIVIGQDVFGGGNESDGFGNTIHMGDLTMGTIFVGGKVIHNFDRGFFADGRFCMGAVHYSQVEAEFSGPLVTSFHDEFLEDTWTFGMDIRGHGGIRLGPIGIVIGMGLRFLLPPNEGGRVDLDSGAFWTWDFDLGIELGF